MTERQFYPRTRRPATVTGRVAGTIKAMPTISEFYGIIIRMFFRDHAPPHFHAVYGEHELVVGISPIAVLEGEAPGRVRSMVLEWTALHQDELMANWDRCRENQQPSRIPPLE